MKNKNFYYLFSLEELFDEFETCLLHIKEGVGKDKRYVKIYAEETKKILKAMKLKPKKEKIEFVAKLIKRENMAYFLNDELAYNTLNRYINLFWKRII